MIKSRSIEVDEDTAYGKQASINPGSIFIPNSMDDETSESGDEDYEDDEYSDDEEDDEAYDESGPAGGYPPVPVQYGGGYGPWAQPVNPETSVSVSSDMGYPSFYGGDKEKYKYKKKKGGGKKKKGGNINCIIITKGGHHKHHQHRKKPSKLFGIFPLGGNRRSIARGLRALKN